MGSLTGFVDRPARIYADEFGASTKYGNSLMGTGEFTAMMAAASSTGRTVGSSTGRRKAKARPSVGEADEMRHRLDVFPLRLSRAGDSGSLVTSAGLGSRERGLRPGLARHVLTGLGVNSI